MSEDSQIVSRVDFFEQIHHEFLYLKGYGTYAYINCRDVDRLYDTYLHQQKAMTNSLTQQPGEVNFIRSFIKSL